MDVKVCVTAWAIAIRASDAFFSASSLSANACFSIANLRSANACAFLTSKSFTANPDAFRASINLLVRSTSNWNNASCKSFSFWMVSYALTFSASISWLIESSLFFWASSNLNFSASCWAFISSSFCFCASLRFDSSSLVNDSIAFAVFLCRINDWASNSYTLACASASSCNCSLLESLNAFLSLMALAFCCANFNSFAAKSSSAFPTVCNALMRSSNVAFSFSIINLADANSLFCLARSTPKFLSASAIFCNRFSMLAANWASRDASFMTSLIPSAILPNLPVTSSTPNATLATALVATSPAFENSPLNNKLMAFPS